jgi:hypothetical protein
MVLALAALLLSGGRTLAAAPRPLPGHDPRPTVLLWGGQLYVRADAFAGWLRQHRQSYGTWAPRHPGAAAILANAESPPRFRRSQLAPTRGPVPPLAAPGPARRVPRSLLGVLAALALVLTVFGMIPRGPLPVLPQRRLGVSAAGIGILVGVAVVWLAG